MNEVIKQISQITKISENDILSKKRHKEISEARQLCCYVLRKEHTLYKCAEIMGFSHSNVHACVKRISDLLSVNDRKTVQLVSMIYLDDYCI